MMEDRDKYIEELSSFVQKCDEKLTSVVSSLGWSMSSITEKVGYVLVIHYCYFCLHFIVYKKKQFWVWRKSIKYKM